MSKSEEFKGKKSKLSVKGYLESQNVSPKHVAKVLITFKFCAWSTWILAIPLCYKVQPLRRFFRLRGPMKLKQRIIDTFPNVMYIFMYIGILIMCYYVDYICSIMKNMKIKY